MRVPFVLLAVAIAIVGAETGATESEETTTATRPAETTDANPAANNSEPSSETQAAGPWDWIPDGGNEREICLGLRCKDNPKVCIGNRQLCDGRNDCRDGSDEDPRFCQFFTSGLAPGEFMSITANMTRGHLAVEVYLCTSQQCNGISPHEWENTKLPKPALYYFKRTGCNNRGQKCKWEETRRTGTWGPRGQHTYVLENHVDHLTLKRTDQPDTVGTVEITPGANNVVVHPFRFRQWETYSVTFGERQRLKAIYSMLLIRVRDGIRDNVGTAKLDTLITVASDMAVKEEEKRAIRWMQLAMATRPVPTNASGYILTTDVIQYLTGALGAAQQAKDLNEEDIKNQLQTKGQEYSKGLGEKLNTTHVTLYNVVLPQVENLVETFENQTIEAENQKDEAGKDIETKEEKLADLERRKIAAKFILYLGKTLNLVSTAMGGGEDKTVDGVTGTDWKYNKTAIGVGGKAGELIGTELLAKLENEIKDLQSDIKKLKKLQESMKNLGELLSMSLNLVQDLKKAETHIDLRAWLAGPAMLTFKTRLIMMTAEDLPVATSGLILIDIIRELGRSITEMMDKIEWYETQQVIVDLVTPPLLTADSDEVREGLLAMRTLVGQHMVVADYRATMRGMQQYALPYCSVLATSEAERCLEGYDLNGVARCVSSIYEGLLAKLKKDKASITGQTRTIGSFYRDEDADRSFITWSNKKHSAQIADVLSGKPVVLAADVFEGMDDTFVVKFKEITLQFWVDDDAVNEELKTALEAFKMSLMHMGSSHFRCGSEAFSLAHRDINITTTFLSDDKGVPQWFSGEYMKLRNGDMVLSPYGVWSVQLLPHKSNADFATLKRFASLVDMSLSGEGSYVSEAVSCEGCAWDSKIAPPRRDSSAAMGPKKRRLYNRKKPAPSTSP